MSILDIFKKNKDKNNIDVNNTSKNNVLSRELAFEQASDSVKTLIKLVDCPYKIFSDKCTSKELNAIYKNALAEGKEKGFTPVLVPADDTLIEFMEILINDDGYSKGEALKYKCDNGKEILDKRYAEYTNSDEETEFPNMDEFLGEKAYGEIISSLCSFENIGGEGVKETILFKIPTKNPWEVVAYIPFGGWNECPEVIEMMAICKHWYEKYGAIPATISHDVMEFVVDKPIKDEESWELAKEHYAFSPDRVDQCTASGTLGEVADCLSKSTVWYIWWD